jgi:hypothetical protein
MAGNERAKERERERKTPEAKRARERSRTEYRGRRGEARKIARAKFAEMFADSLWRGPRLRSGERVERYLSDDTFSVKQPDGKSVVVRSLQPLTYEDGGRRVAVETGLAADGSSLRAEHTPAQARIAKSARGGVELPRSDIAFRLVGAEGEAELDGDKAFFADALGGEDLDLAVAALPTGAAVLLQLRSQEAPEQAELAFTLPPGAALRLTRDTGDGSPPSDRAGAEVVRDGKVLARIAAPAAWDAGGETVPVSYALDGDRLTIRVPHRGGDWEYPLAVDPYIQENYLWNQSNTDNSRWGYGETRGEFEPYDCSTSNPYSAYCGMPVSSGPGMYVKAPGWVAYNLYAHAEWYWQAPPNTNIVRVDWNYAHAVGNQDCAYGYINGPLEQGGTGAQGTPAFCTDYSSGNSWQTSCTAHPGCDTARSTPGNWAIFGLMMFNGTINDAWAHLKNAYIALWEGQRPTWSAVSEQSGWFQPGSGSHTFNAWASDVGLGVKQVRFRRPSKASGTVTDSAPPSNCDGSHYAPCPLGPVGYTWAYPYSDLPDGINTLGLLAEDIVGNPSSGDPGAGTYDARSWQVKVDSTTPTYNPHSGALSRTAADGWITDPSPSLTVDIRDPSPNGGQVSGVKFSKIEYDPTSGPSQTKNNDKADGSAGPCDAQSGCKATLPHTFAWTSAPEGSHSVRVSTDDATGQHPRTQTWGVKLDHTKPTISTPTGTLYAPNAWMQEGAKTVHVDTSDATSGVKKVELTVQPSGGAETVVQTKTPATCCPSSFPADLAWTPSASDAEGTYDIRVKAYDDAGNQPEVRQWQVKLDNAPPTVTLSGALKDAEGMETPSNANLSVTAQDSRSGVKSVEIKVDGGVKATQTNPTPCDGCPITMSWNYHAADYAPGKHTITVTATDEIGHAAPPRSWDVYTESTPPEVTTGGNLWLADGKTIAEPSYNLTVQAGDGFADQPGVGTKRIEVKVDGASVHAVTQPCDAGNCEMSTQWNFNTADYSEGEHLVETIVTDQAGTSDTAEVSVDVRKIETKPAQSMTLGSFPARRIDGATFGDGAGSSVASLGDVNADGLDDYAVGAPGANANGRVRSGSVHVVLGGSDNLNLDTLPGSTTPGTFRIDGALPNEAAGTAVAAAGDVNGDDIGDIAVGAPSPGGVVGGRVYVVFGSAAVSNVDLGDLGTRGFAINGPATPVLPLVGANTRTFGSTLSAPNAGVQGADSDTNGDDLDDIVIGSSGESRNARDGSGSAYVIFGKSSTAAVDAGNLTSSQGYRVDGQSVSAQTGWAAGVVGDVSGDDLADIVVTAPGANTSGRTTAGTAYVIFGGGTSNIDLAASNGNLLYAIRGASGDALGSSIANAGDTDNDGVSDLIIGGHGAFVVPGGQDFADSVDLTQQGGLAYRLSPPVGVGYDRSEVGSAGDLNDDGIADMLVGFPEAGAGAGQTYVLLSQRGVLPGWTSVDLGTLPGQNGSSIQGPAPGDRAGSSLTAIDADANGEPAFVVGAPGADPASRVDAGSAWVVPASELSGAQQPSPPPAAAATTDGPPPLSRPGTRDSCYKHKSPAYRYEEPETDFPRLCRLTVKSNLEQTRNADPKGFGKRATFRHEPPDAANVRATLKPGRRMKQTSTTMLDGRRGFVLYDSDQQTIGYLRHFSREPREADDTAASLEDEEKCASPCLSLYNEARERVAINAPDQKMTLRFESTPCMSSRLGKSAPGAYALISVQGDGNNPMAGLRAIVARSNLPNGASGRDLNPGDIEGAVPKNSDGTSLNNDQWLDMAWLNCARRGKYLNGKPSAPNYAHQGFTSGDGYQSWLGAFNCDHKYHAKYPDTNRFHPGCGVDGRTGAALFYNYEYPRQTGFNFTNIAMFSHTSTGIGGGGIVRGLFRVPAGGLGSETGKRLVMSDKIGYLDHAVPCFKRARGEWEYDTYMGVSGWLVRRDVDDNAGTNPETDDWTRSRENSPKCDQANPPSP